MSEERRISLAELLAREGGTPPAPAGGRRRRHRGGENSITVAELTGEIPIIRDDQPAPGGEAPAEQPTPEVPVAPEVPAAPEAPVAQPVRPALVQRAAYEPEVVTPEVVEPETEAPAVPEQAAHDDEPITSSFLAAAVAAPGPDEAPAPQENAPQENALQENALQEPEAPAVDENLAQPEGRRSGLLRWGRGPRTAEAPQEPVPAPESAAEPVAEQAVEPAAAQTDDAPSADAAQADDGRDYAWSRWDQAEAPIMATADFNTAQVRERQTRFAEVEADDTVDVAPVSVPTPGVDPDVPAAPDTAAMSAQRIEDARVESTPDFLAETGEDTDEGAAETAESSGKGRGWLALAAEVVLGLSAGAGLFYGFFKLWNWGGGRATVALTVVLAFIVIIGIVTFTHYLRKTTDYLTLVLALFVGLVITFGPLLMALGSN